MSATLGFIEVQAKKLPSINQKIKGKSIDDINDMLREAGAGTDWLLDMENKDTPIDC